MHTLTAGLLFAGMFMPVMLHALHTLQGPRLIIQPLQPAMCHIFEGFAARSWEDFQKFEPAQGLERQALNGWLSRRCQETHGQCRLPKFYAIQLQENAQYVGLIALTRASDPSQGRLELAYWIHSPFQGQGYAQEALCLMLHYGFKILNVEKIMVNVDIAHRRAAEVALSLGMKCELLRKNGRHYSHEDSDALTLSLHASDPLKPIAWGCQLNEKGAPVTLSREALTHAGQSGFKALQSKHHVLLPTSRALPATSLTGMPLVAAYQVQQRQDRALLGHVLMLHGVHTQAWAMEIQMRHPKHWSGFFEIFQVLVRHLFQNNPLLRLEVSCVRTDAVQQAFLTAMGFACEGVLKDHSQGLDISIYAMTQISALNSKAFFHKHFHAVCVQEHAPCV